MSVSNRRRLVRLIAVVMLPPVIVSSVTIFLAQSNRVYPESRDSDWAAEQLDCPDYPLLDDPKCWIRLDAADAPVFLLGDSNATMFSDAVYGGTTRPVFKGHAGRCPFIALDKTSEDCRIFYEMTIGSLSQQKPGTVVLAFSDAYFWDRSVNHDMGNYGDSADLQAGLSKTIRRIKDAGHDVVVILPVHVFNGTPFTWQKCSLLTAVIEGCNLGIPRQYVSDVQRNTRNAISEAAAQHGAQTIDVRPFLCDEDTCPIQRDNRFLYADEAHISAGLSSSLAPHFSKYL